MKCPYCHNPFLPSDEKVKWDTFEGETILLHPYCFSVIETEAQRIHDETKRQLFLRSILRKLSAAIVVMIFLSFTKASAEVRSRSEWVRGAIVIGVTNSGSCVYKPFVKVGDTEPDDMGEAQILGFEPGNVQVGKNGEIVWERVYEKQFIRLHGFKSVNGRMCRCPPYDE